MMHTFSIKLFVGLLAGHAAGDFLLQTSKDVLDKHRLPILFKHSATVAILSYAACGLWQAWDIAALVFASHAVIDGAKELFSRKVIKSGQLSLFFMDQSAHFVVLAALSIYPGVGKSSWWAEWLGPSYLHVLILFSGLVIAVRAGSIVIEMAVKPYLVQMKQAGLEPVQGLVNGGRTIGQLERALIFLFVTTGQPGAIGFLIAAKSILRFGEIKERENRMEAEYIIIGTLMSFLFGLSVSYGAVYLLNRIP